jgi:hypothetical protein
LSSALNAAERSLCTDWLALRDGESPILEGG